MDQLTPYLGNDCLPLLDVAALRGEIHTSCNYRLAQEPKRAVVSLAQNLLNRILRTSV